MRVTPEISFRQAVTTGSTFHSMGCKTCLLVWHIEPAHQTQSVTSGENNNCVQVSRLSICTQSQTGIMGMMSEHWDFWHVSNISRDFERDWARALFLPAGRMITYFSFQKSLSIISQSQKTSKLSRNESVTHLWINQVNQLCVRRGQLLKIANDGGL